MKFDDITKARELQYDLERMEDHQVSYRELAPMMPNGQGRDPMSGLLKLFYMAQNHRMPLEGPTAEKIIAFARGALLEYADAELERIRKELVALGVEMR